jgi:hypothetical protein
LISDFHQINSCPDLGFVSWKVLLGYRVTTAPTVGSSDLVTTTFLDASEQVTVRTSTPEQVQIALVGLVPVQASTYQSFRPSKLSFSY